MIGVAGCGRMGAPMLTALRRAGFAAVGFDVRREAAQDCPEGALLPDPGAFAADIETLITVVRDIDETEDVLFQSQGFATAPRLRRIIVCSTLSPRYVMALPARVPDHLTLIDAPMSGARIAAQEARLSFMLGGTPEALDAVQPILNAMGAHFHRMGPFGSGMKAKVLNNLLAASNTAMTRLVLEWARTMDLDETRLLSLIDTSSGQNWFASQFDEIEFARDGHAPDNTIGILVKDIASALDAAPDGADLSLPQQVQTAIRGLAPFPKD